MKTRPLPTKCQVCVRVRELLLFLSRLYRPLSALSQTGRQVCTNSTETHNRSWFKRPSYLQRDKRWRERLLVAKYFIILIIKLWRIFIHSSETWRSCSLDRCLNRRTKLCHFSKRASHVSSSSCESEEMISTSTPMSVPTDVFPLSADESCDVRNTFHTWYLPNQTVRRIFRFRHSLTGSSQDCRWSNTKLHAPHQVWHSSFCCDKNSPHTSLNQLSFCSLLLSRPTNIPAAAVLPVVLMSWWFSPLTLKLTANNPTAGRKQSSVLWMFPSVKVSFPPQHLSVTCFNHCVFLM